MRHPNAHVEHTMRQMLLAILLTTTAWASSPTPEQTAWLNTVFANLYQGSPSTQAQRSWTYVIVNGLLDIDVNDPPGFGGSSPQMSQETCDALAMAIRNKADECGDIWDSLDNCHHAATIAGANPGVVCLAIQNSPNNCHTALINMSVDWNNYCDKP
jgi:hypothetical protein